MIYLNWLILNEINQLDNLVELSYNQAVIIYKHSTRCHISSFVKNRLESEWPADLKVKIFYLDLLAYRSISHAISEKFSVEHQSPQLLVIRNGECIHVSSHSDIDAGTLSELLDGQKSLQ